MKKISAILLSLIVASNSTFAAQTHNQPGHIVGTCGFIDTVNFVGPKGTNVMSISSSGGLTYQKVTPTQYYVEDNGSCEAGVVNVQVGTDPTHISTIQITDGPWQYINTTQTNSVGDYNFNNQVETANDVYSLYFKQQ